MSKDTSALTCLMGMETLCQMADIPPILSIWSSSSSPMSLVLIIYTHNKKVSARHPPCTYNQLFTLYAESSSLFIFHLFCLKDSAGIVLTHNNSSLTMLLILCGSHLCSLGLSSRNLYVWVIDQV